MKVSETTDTQLDWLVAKCEAARLGTSYVATPEGKLFINSPMNPVGRMKAYRPSTDPAQGQPILERERIKLSPMYNPNYWTAMHSDSAWFDGPTMLIAGLRCFVASKLGDEVEVPDGLA